MFTRHDTFVVWNVQRCSLSEGMDASAVSGSERASPLG
jgi:hypothetical protein